MDLPLDSTAGAQHATRGALRFIVADDHEVVRIALRTALAPLAERIEWLEASCATEAQQLLSSDQDLDAALLDLSMPGGGVAWIAEIRRAHPQVPLAIISGTEDPALVRELLALGVSGFIPKSDSAAVIMQAVRLILAGGLYAPLRLLGAVSQPAAPPVASGTTAGLTARQLEVLQHLGRGLSNKLIARALGLSEGTVKAHLLSIYRVLGCSNRTEAVVAARDWLARREGA